MKTIDELLQGPVPARGFTDPIALDTWPAWAQAAVRALPHVLLCIPWDPFGEALLIAEGEDEPADSQAVHWMLAFHALDYPQRRTKAAGRIIYVVQAIQAYVSNGEVDGLADVEETLCGALAKVEHASSLADACVEAHRALDWAKGGIGWPHQKGDENGHQ